MAASVVKHELSREAAAGIMPGTTSVNALAAPSGVCPVYWTLSKVVWTIVVSAPVVSVAVAASCRFLCVIVNSVIPCVMGLWFAYWGN